MRLLLAAFIVVALTGCGTTAPIKGRYVDETGKGIAGAKVNAWNSSILMLVVPVLPGRAGEATTDAGGRFEIIPTQRANGLSVQGGGGWASQRLWWLSRDVVICKEPYPPPDYSEINRDGPHDPNRSVTVLVRGAVQTPGKYSLKANNSVWQAIESAGGIVSSSSLDIELVRRPDAGTVFYHYLDWTRRAEAKVPPLLCDGDEIAVNVPMSDLLAAKAAPESLRTELSPQR